ncbi:FAD-binding oxidoreductase [Motiliproteus sp. MSK22-1]|uniref:FAD-binding oxidoreductase n=1 Tax=Motiliproteus sp. MSK22-1 TaxID=1897630 RepID=UPI000977B426|nr:FAD-linked oxidase C-terminal domain-containing protein [Motiliproteus sp. MSK22-1]OMH39044.1 2-hydroxy-acid oxidase [Motiliproteus sp. MSK22-1]
MSNKKINASNINPDISSVIEFLAPHFGERLSTATALRVQHGQGEDSHGCIPPDAVVYPSNNDEVALIARICNEYKVPLIPYGTGTSVEGHLLALQGGISIDLSQMDQILSVNAEDMDCRIQAGVTREQLNTDLRYQGLFFPVDPGANASLGGMAATCASGTNAVRYGTMRENVKGLTIVTADGRIIATGTRARKTSAGYSLTQLMIGSEGTLGIITEIQLKLHPIPELTKAAVCSFKDLEGAVNTVIEAIQLGIPVARIELLNSLQMKASIQYSKLSAFEEAPTLFFEFHGSTQGVAEQIGTIQALSDHHGGSAFRWAENTEDRNTLWKARHQAYFAGMSLQPGSMSIPTDVCVPISRLADSILDAERYAESLGLQCPIVGHVGDGNYHILIIFDENNSEQKNNAKRLSNYVVEQALAMGGTCTGEHGIGSGKKEYLLKEHGEGVELMRTIKLALDPNRILNPGKVFD